VTYYEPELHAPSPEEFERHLGALPAWELSSLPTETWTMVTIPGIELALPLPPGHLIEELEHEQAPPVRDWAAKVDADTTMVIQRAEGITGYPNFVLQWEGGERLSEARYSSRREGHPAEVRLLRYGTPDGIVYGATIFVVLRRGSYFGAGIVSSTETGREKGLTAVALARFLPAT
jgi:hypothetical protein